MTLAVKVLVLQAAVLLFVSGCEESGPRVSDAAQKALPTLQYALSENVCPEGQGMPPDQEERTRHRGERQLDALLAAYENNPDAIVDTRASSSDETPNIQHEDLTVGELLETHLSTAEELAEGDTFSPCFDRVAEQLRAARDAD